MYILVRPNRLTQKPVPIDYPSSPTPPQKPTFVCNTMVISRQLEFLNIFTALQQTDIGKLRKAGRLGTCVSRIDQYS